MIQFSLVFTVVLSLVFLMVIVSPAGAQALRKQKSLGPVPQRPEGRRWRKECFELSVVDKVPHSGTHWLE